MRLRLPLRPSGTDVEYYPLTGVMARQGYPFSSAVRVGSTVTYFRGNLPARSALGANGLALGARVELECIATLDPASRR